MTSHPSFLDRITQSASRHAKRPAFSSGGITLSYSDLFALAHGIRDHIVEQGFGHARRVGIVTSVSAQTYASLLSVWSLGAAYVPINCHNPAERNARIIQQARLDLILTSRGPQSWPTHLPDSAGMPRVLSTLNTGPNAAPLEFVRSAPSEVAYIFFTSGSTGSPKGVPISHANLSAFMHTMLSGHGYEFDAEDRFLQMFERTFDLSIVSILAPWSVGGCCCVVPEKGIAYMNILDVLANEKVTVALMVPSVLAYMKRFFSEVRFPALRLSQFCGEALMQEMTADWSQCVPNAQIENLYGPTEATIYCTRYPWDRELADFESRNGIVPVGKPLPGTRVLIVDDDGLPCQAGVRGELCLAGDQVMSGYWNDSAKTAEGFVTVSVDGMQIRAYRTGDIAYVNANDNLIYCGRKDSQVKIDGRRIELGEIEYFARQSIGSSAVAAVVAKDRSGVDRLRLFVGGGNIDRAVLDRCLRDNLPSYMLPSAITMLPDLPLNLNGKIDRPALARMAAE